MPTGRPSDYTDEIAEKICERLSTSELGLIQVLDEIRLTDGEAPSAVAVYRWLEQNETFRNNYSRARLLQAEVIHDRAQMEAQTPRIGRIEKTTPKGDEVTVADNVERSKLIVSTMLKRASQLNPKKYGDKVQAEVTGKGGGPIMFVPAPIGSDSTQEAESNE